MIWGSIGHGVVVAVELCGLDDYGATVRDVDDGGIYGKWIDVYLNKCDWMIGRGY